MILYRLFILIFALICIGLIWIEQQFVTSLEGMQKVNNQLT